jgi:hypothetical protein
MRYQEVQPISRMEAEAALAGDSESAIVDALLRIAYYEADWRWVQNKCIIFLQSTSQVVRQTAIQCLGHVARIHGALDLDIVMPRLQELQGEPTISGFIEDAIDDIHIFVREQK